MNIRLIVALIDSSDDSGKSKRAVEEVRRILIGVARGRSREGITYTVLTEKTTTISVDQYSALLNDILGQVSEEGHLNGDGMLSVLMHYKDPRRGSGQAPVSSTWPRSTSGTLVPPTG